MSVFSRLNKVSWIADVLTPSAVILMEGLWLYPWLVYIGKLPMVATHQTPLSLISLIVLLGISFVATRFFLKWKWPTPWIQISIMACGLIVIFLVLRIEYSTGIPLFSGQWFTSYGNVIIDFFSTKHSFVFALIAGLYLWWRGINLSRTPLYFNNIYTSFMIQLATLVFLIIMWGFSFKDEPVQTLTSDIGIYVAGFFFFGLVALAISNLKVVQERIKTKGASSNNFGRRWLTIIFSVIGGMVLLAIGFSSIFSTQWVASLQRLLGGISDAYSNVVYFLFLVIGYVVEFILNVGLWIINWFRHVTNAKTFQPQQLGETINNTGNMHRLISPEVMLIIKLAITAIVFIVLLFLITKAIRPRLSRTDEDLEEEHESLWSWGGFISDVIAFFKMIFQRFQRKTMPVLSNVSVKWQPEEDIRRRLSIREIYQHLLWQGARLRIPRESYETPSEYAGRLGRLAPDSIEPLQEITSLYIDVRYGEYQVEDKKTDDANIVWEKLLNILKGNEGQTKSVS